MKVDSSRKKTLFFVENKAQVDIILLYLRENNSYKVISLYPEAGYFLNRRKIPYSVPEEYYSKNEVKRNPPEFKHLEEFCDYLGKYLLSHSEVLKKYNSTLDFFPYYHFHLLFDAVISRIYILQKILSKEKPDYIYCFGLGPGQILPELLFIKEHLYSRVLRIVLKNYGKAKATELSSEKRGINSHKIKSGIGYKKNLLKNFLSRILGDTLVEQYHFFKSNPNAYIKSLFLKKKFSKKESLLILNRSYDIEYVLKGLIKKEKFNIIFWDAAKRKEPIFLYPMGLKCKYLDIDNEEITLFKKETEYIWNNLAKDEKFRKHFIYSEIDFFPVLESKFKFFVTQTMVEIFECHLKTKQLIRRYKPFLVLDATYTHCIDKTIASVCRGSRIPVAVYQHGDSGYRDYPLFYYINIKDIDYFFCYGQGVKEYFEKFKNNTKIHPVGSARLDNLRKKNKDDRESLCKNFGLNPLKKIVIYILTNMSGDFNSFSYHGSPDNEYFKIQRDIVNIFKEFPDIQFIIKLFPNPQAMETPLANFIKDENISNCQTLKYIPFCNLFPLGNLYIIDCASTPLLEALTTKKPIIVCDSDPRIDKDTVRILKRRVEYTSSLKEGEEIIKCYLKEKRFAEIENPNTEFLKLYGTHLNDGKSAQRTLEAIEEIIV